jgi:fatty acid desaturase
VLSRGKARIEVADHGGDLGGGREWLKVATTQLALAALLTLSLGWWGYPLLWLLPLASVAAFCNNLRAFVEHSAARDSAQPVERLRDYLPGPVEAARFSPCHFHFHALHHAYPSIPHYRLPAAKRDLTAIGGSYPYVVAPGYLRALTQHLGQL